MCPDRLNRLRHSYRTGLLDDVIPFWTRYSPDTEFGGFMTCLDRRGRVIDTDKAIWPQGRMSWMFATMYCEVERREDWLKLALSGAEFLQRHGFSKDGRMFFHVTREGKPIRQRRYFFSECFTAMAYATLARAGAGPEWGERARSLFGQIIRYVENPDLLAAKFTKHRPTQSLAVPMILLSTAEVLREAGVEPAAAGWIEKSISIIEEFFVCDAHAVVFETVGRQGEILDHFDGRLLNPGHAIEAAWFILREAKRRGHDPRLITLGTKMLDWMWERGWDAEYGGLFYYRDLRDLPIQEYWHDMKFWWPHNEAAIATLLAWQLTHDEKYLNWHEKVHDWSQHHFADPEYGEWYGYLHRDGRVSTTLKGNLWKSAFHLPRMQLLCWQILEEEAARSKKTI